MLDSKIAMGARIGLVIFLLSFTIRASYLLAAGSPYLTQRLEAENVASAFARQGEFADPYVIPTGPSMHCSPGYPAFLGSLYKVFGENLLAKRIECAVTVVVNSATLSLLPLLSHSMNLGFLPGAIGGVLAALFPHISAVEQCGGWEAPYAAFAVALFSLLGLRAAAQNRWPVAIAGLFGALAGLSVLMAAQLLVLALVFPVALCLKYPERQIPAGFYLVLFALVLSPWIWRNYRQFGVFVPVRGNLGLELAMSNNDEASAYSISNQAFFNSHPFRSESAARHVAAVGEAKFFQEQKEVAVRWIQEHPRKFAELTLLRAAYFWGGVHSNPWFFAVRTLLTLTAFAGVWLAARQGANVIPILIIWSLYPLPYYLLSIYMRYRFPIDWTIFLCAGVTVHVVWAQVWPGAHERARALFGER